MQNLQEFYGGDNLKNRYYTIYREKSEDQILEIFDLKLIPLIETLNNKSEYKFKKDDFIESFKISEFALTYNFYLDRVSLRPCVLH